MAPYSTTSTITESLVEARALARTLCLPRISSECNFGGTKENNGSYKRGELMKSKTLVLATLQLVTAFLLTQAIVPIAPHTALAASGWTDSHGPGCAYALVYDSVHNLLYAVFLPLRPCSRV